MSTHIWRLIIKKKKKEEENEKYKVEDTGNLLLDRWECDYQGFTGDIKAFGNVWFLKQVGGYSGHSLLLCFKLNI